VPRGQRGGGQEGEAAAVAAAAAAEEEGEGESAPPQSDGEKREDIVVALQAMVRARLLPLRMVGP